MVGVTYAGKDADGHNILYGTTNGTQSGADQGNALMKLVDNGSGSSWSLVTLSPNNTWLRGLAFVPSAAALAGDYNHDGFVGQDDLNLVLSHWGQNVAPEQANGDGSGDGFVGQDDLNQILGDWGKGGEASGIAAGALAAVPEPASIGLLGTVAMALVRRRRR
jgi:hypothetical protein